MEHLLRKLLFPAPIASYDWSSMPGELICVIGRYIDFDVLVESHDFTI
jgi:hypothetical protein